MRVRESGMPPRDAWEALFDVPRILDELQVGSHLDDVIEVGCGYGTFTLPVARRVSGQVHALDIDPAMVEATRDRAREEDVGNVHVDARDVLETGFGVDDAVDAVLLFNILHGEDPVALLEVAATALRPGGHVLAIHWRHDPTTPRGPPMRIRPRPKDLEEWALETGLLEVEEGPVDLPPWHYGWRFRRTG